jgi:hypothetical protein
MLLDGYFLTEGWKDFSFEGRLLIGNTGSEECVLQSVCSWYPRSSPPPALTTLATTLSSVLPASSINSIFTAYGISDKIEKGELVDKLLKFIADIAFCKPAHDHASEWRKRGNEVYQFLFEQKQPFTGIYKGKAAHSLDLAYLHGNPAIFLNAKDPEGERKIQKAFQDSWIGFAHGEKSWGKEVVRRFGPGEVVDENLETVNGEWFRRKEWKSWEGLSAEQVEPLAWLVTAFVGGLSGFESH